MRQFAVGDTVRIDVPDETDPDYERLHGERGTIVEILDDDAPDVTGDERDAYLFGVDVETRSDAGMVWVRWRDLRPTSDGEST